MVIFYKLVIETQIFLNKEKYNVVTLTWEKFWHGDAANLPENGRYEGTFTIFYHFSCNI